MAFPSLMQTSVALPWVRLAVSGTAVTNDTLTDLSMDSLIGSRHWPTLSLPITAITFPMTGKVDVSIFDLDWTPGATNNVTGYRAVALLWNGATAQRFSCHPASPTAAIAGDTAQSGFGTFEVTAGDTVAFRLRQNSGATLTPALVHIYVAYRKVGN